MSSVRHVHMISYQGDTGKTHSCCLWQSPSLLLCKQTAPGLIETPQSQPFLLDKCSASCVFIRQTGLENIAQVPVLLGLSKTRGITGSRENRHQTCSSCYLVLSLSSATNCLFASLHLSLAGCLSEAQGNLCCGWHF